MRRSTTVTSTSDGEPAKIPNQSYMASRGKYIPPHRRKLDPSATASSQSFSSTLVFSNKNKFTFTHHGKERKTQRGISNRAVETTLHSGISLEHHDAVTHIDEDTQVVRGKDGRIITILDNKRNTKYDILRVNKRREQQLISKAERNNDAAMCELAELYLDGDLGERDVQKAKFWLLKAADERKNSHAMCLLSELYQSGDLGQRDPKAAMEWLEKAADRNNRYALAIIAQYYLGLYKRLKEDEISRKSEIKQKIQTYLQRSANKGATRAMWQIARIHEDGLFGEVNLPKAIEIYCKAARLGSPTSLSTLQQLCETGKISEEQFEEVLDEASKLIARTSSELAVDIGLSQIEGKLGKDPARGLWMLEASAKKNNVDAIKVLAKCYAKGRGCDINLSLSQYWYGRLRSLYEKAGSQDNLSAIWDLGHLFLSGKLGQVDYDRAEQAFIRTAQTGNIFSCFYLGTLYIEGSLGDKDPQMGVPWIEKALMLWEERALSGDKKAIRELISTYLDKEIGFKNYSRALKWLTILAEQHSGSAMWRLARLHMSGKAGEKNIKEAIRWLLLLSDHSLKILASRAAYVIDQMLTSREWSIDNKEIILTAIVRHADRSKEEKPFRIGRMLGDIYSQGILIEPNYEKAIFWYERAGNLNNSIALLKLGLLYASKALGEQNLSKAITYFTCSAALGNEEAKEKLDSLNNINLLVTSPKNILDSTMLPDEANESDTESDVSDSESVDETNDDSLDPEILSEKYYQKSLERKISSLETSIPPLKTASDLGLAKASFELGELYALGQLGEKVKPVALLFYKRAAKQKHTTAMERLIAHYTTGLLGPTDPSKANKWKSRLTAITP